VGTGFLYCAYNDAYRPFLDGRPEALGRRFFEVWPELRDAFGPLLESVRQGRGAGFEETAVTLHRDGAPERRYFHFSFDPVRAPDGTVMAMLTFGLEVTQRVRARTELEQGMERLRLRLGAEATGFASYDFDIGTQTSNWSNSIHSLVQHEAGGRVPQKWISEQVHPDDRERFEDFVRRTQAAVGPTTQAEEFRIVRGDGDVRWVRDSNQVLTRLVDDLLGLARINRGDIEVQREPVRLAEVVETAVEQVRSLAEERGHTLTVTTSAPALRVNADFERLTQVIANIVGNAVKYMEPGGRIDVGTTVEGDQALVSVRDTGYGIPPERLENIFAMFRQVPEHRQLGDGGLGIGLALSRRLVALHDGSIEAFSDGPGRGSEFVVRLPVDTGTTVLPDQRATPAPNAGEAGSGPCTRILIVDGPWRCKIVDPIPQGASRRHGTASTHLHDRHTPWKSVSAAASSASSSSCSTSTRSSRSSAAVRARSRRSSGCWWWCCCPSSA